MSPVWSGSPPPADQVLAIVGAAGVEPERKREVAGGEFQAVWQLDVAFAVQDQRLVGLAGVERAAPLCTPVPPSSKSTVAPLAAAAAGTVAVNCTVCPTVAEFRLEVNSGATARTVTDVAVLVLPA